MYLSDVYWDLIVENDPETFIQNKERNDYELLGNIHYKDYIEEKLKNKEAHFFCNKCAQYHNYVITDFKWWTDSEFGPWLKVKVIEDDNWHDIEPYAILEIFGKQSKLSKKHDKLREEAIKNREIRKEAENYNL